MKLGFGMDEITQGVRLNDVAMEMADGNMDKLAGSFDIDMVAVEHVAKQRAMMGMQMIYNTMGIPDDPMKRINLQATLAAMWADGFFAAVHAVEQKERVDKA